MTYRAFRYSGIFFWLLKTGLELCKKIQNLGENLVLRIHLSMQSICSFSPFLPMSRDWSLQLIRAVPCAPSSLFCLLLPEGFASFARPRCTLWTVAVSILLQQETQQLLANATLKLNHRPFLELNRKLLWKAVKICEIELHRNSTNTFVCVSAWPYTLWLVSSS